VALDDRVLEVGRSGLKSLSMIDSGHGRRIYRGVVPQKARLRLSLNIPLEALHDEHDLAWDVSGKGHWGNGATEVGLSEESDFVYVMGLMRQAFEYQMGGD
jgi:predicted transport protein